jgi:hypothetical protein
MSSVPVPVFVVGHAVVQQLQNECHDKRTKRGVTKSILTLQFMPRYTTGTELG